MERLASGRGGEALSLMRFDVSTAHEAAQEFILPDYMPEVRRIVSCTAHALPENKYLTSEAVELSGLAVYSVLYIGDDGALSCAPLNTEYSVKMTCASADTDEFGTADVGAYTAVESVICRATGPRKLSLTARMRSRAFSVRSMPVTEKITAVSEDGEVRGATTADSITLERHKTETNVSLFSFDTASGSVSGELREREGTKMILCSGSADIKTAAIENGGVTVRGDAYLNCLMLTPEGTYSAARVKAPIEEHIQTDALSRLAKASGHDAESAALSAVASARVASASAVGDDNGVFDWEIEYDIDTEIVATENVLVTDDAYSTAYGCRTTEQEPEIVSSACTGMSSLTVYGTKQVTGGEGKIAPYSSGRVSYERAETTPDGKTVLIGNCTVSAVTVGDGDASSEDVVIPVRFECDGRIPEDCSGGPNVRCVMSVDYTDARLDGDKLTVTAELSVSYSVTVKKKVRHIAEVEIDRSSPVDRCESSVRICFPEEGENRWSIGKKYRCEDKRILKIDGSSAFMIVPDRGV